MSKRFSAFLLPLFFAAAILPWAQDSPLVAVARANRAEAEAKKDVDSDKKNLDSEWYNPTRVTLHEQSASASATTTFEMGGSQDLKIAVNGRDKDGRAEKAELMFIQGQRQWMLTKGTQLPRGYEIDALDGPILELKLVTELLRAALPDGPSQVKAKKTFHLQRNEPINVNTTSASGGLDGPWTLDGSIEPAGENQWTFSLTFKHDEPVRVTGTWQRADAAPIFPDTTPLQGWQVLTVGPIKSTDGNNTILDYGAQPSQQHPKTLGELRVLAAK